MTNWPNERFDLNRWRRHDTRAYANVRHEFRKFSTEIETRIERRTISRSPGFVSLLSFLFFLFSFSSTSVFLLVRAARKSLYKLISRYVPIRGLPPYDVPLSRSLSNRRPPWVTHYRSRACCVCIPFSIGLRHWLFYRSAPCPFAHVRRHVDRVCRPVYIERVHGGVGRPERAPHGRGHRRILTVRWLTSCRPLHWQSEQGCNWFRVIKHAARITAPLVRVYDILSRRFAANREAVS